MWIFGYGSLVWKVDFPYTHKIVGYIQGYDRRFWQASIDHRGTPEKPGRVVTLVPSINRQAKVWGICYKVEDQDAIAKLIEREKRFSQICLEFFPLPQPHPDKDESCSSFQAITFIGSVGNPLFLGDASLEDIVLQIAGAQGPSGTNAEYIFKLAEFTRSHFPNATVWGAAYKIDDSRVEEVIRKLDQREVMGYEKVPIEFQPISSHPLNEGPSGSDVNLQPFQVTMYYGSHSNEHYWGEATLEVIAETIWKREGPSGKNKDYLFNLINSMRQIKDFMPDTAFARSECSDGKCDTIVDGHLTQLERLVVMLEKKSLVARLR